MRRQLTIAAVALSSMIVVAVLVPFALLVRTLAEDRAVSNGELQAQTLLPVLATLQDLDDIAPSVDALNASSGSETTVHLEDGRTIGEGGPPGPSVELARRRGQAFSTATDRGMDVVLPVRVPDGSVAVIRVVVPDAELHQGVTAAWLILGALAIALVGVAALIADRLARLLTRPVLDLADVAEQLGSGQLDVRVTPSGPKEIVEVGLTLNRLADRIGELVTAEREAIADLSHRLRTPVTALRLDIDALSPGAERQRLERDAEGLTLALDQLIAEARRPVRTEVGSYSDLAAVVRERAAFWAPLAEDQGRAFSVECPADPCPVGVLQVDLAAAVDAVLGNVFSHTEEGVGYRVTVSMNGSPTLTCDDDGPGFPPGTDVVARGTSVGGSSGLGLDIVRRTAESTGGTVEVGRAPGGGARVTARFGPHEAVGR